MTVPTVFVVYRRLPVSRIWQPISRSFSTIEQASRYMESLPLDWTTEIREIPSEVAA